MRYIPYQQTPNGGTSYQSVPTIGSIGGYNQYQTNYYNNFYNPYYIRQQEEARRKLEMQESMVQMKIWARLINCSNGICGCDYMDDAEIYRQIQDRVKDRDQMNADNQFMDQIHNITQKAGQKQIEQMQMQENAARQQEVMSQQPEAESKSFYQWIHEDAFERYMESQYALINKMQRNTSNLYNSDMYRQMLNVHDTAFNNNVNPALQADITIDDMEIPVSLPERLRMERDMRRQAFVESLKRGMG